MPTLKEKIIQESQRLGIDNSALLMLNHLLN